MAASVNLRCPPNPQNVATLHGLPNYVRIVAASSPRMSGSGVCVRFPTLFPFWRLDVSPTDAQNQASSGILIFAGLTSAILLLFGFGLVLLIQANWRQWRSTQLQEEFVRGVSHDLRTPVANISLHSELLFTGRFAPHQMDHFHHVVYGEARRLASLVGVALESSKRRHRAPELQLVPCDLRQTVIESVNVLEDRISSRGFHVNSTLPESVPLVNCDQTRVARCLENLLDNAVKYSGDARRIVKGIIEGHHGKVEVTSQPDRGSEFALLLPL